MQTEDEPEDLDLLSARKTFRRSETRRSEANDSVSPAPAPFISPALHDPDYQIRLDVSNPFNQQSHLAHLQSLTSSGLGGLPGIDSLPTEQAIGLPDELYGQMAVQMPDHGNAGFVSGPGAEFGSLNQFDMDAVSICYPGETTCLR